MDNLSARLSSLESLVEARQDEIEKRLRKTVVVYSVLVVLIALYTSFVSSKIAEYLEPQAVSEQFEALMRAQIPVQRMTITLEAEQLSRELIGELSETVLARVPGLESYLVSRLDMMADMLAKEIEVQVMPAFTKFVKEEAPALKQQHKDLADGEAAEGFVLLLTDTIGEEADKYLNDNMIGAVGDLKAQLVRLTKPGAKLTRKEDAQRRALIYWAYLAENAEMGSTIYHELIQEASRRFEALLKGEETETEGAPNI